MGLNNNLFQVKNLFRNVYCLECKQKKACQILAEERCCPCYLKIEWEKTEEYNSQEKVLASKKKEQKTRIQQLKLLQKYSGCPQCRSKEVDAFNLYENNKLVCQPCLAKKTSQSSSPISFAKESQWHQKNWGINLNEWLDKLQCLPVNANCAKKWLKDKEHLNNCVCLEKEIQKVYQLFNNSLKEIEQKLEECSCKDSEKFRIDNDNYTWCEICEKSIKVASKKRVIKNRNDPKFWGLEIKEKVLCGECLETRKKDMKPLKRAEFNRYRKVGRL